jgi:acyl-CoA thioester hydrolase
MRLLNTCELPIKWTDLDAYGHVNHSIFFDYMTEARADLLKNFLKKEGETCQFVTAHVECDYKIPYVHPDVVILKQYCESMGSSNFILRYEFYSKANPEKLYASALVRMVAFNPVLKKATRLPKDVIDLVNPEIHPAELTT